MGINNKIKDTYHLTTEKLKRFVKSMVLSEDPILTKRVTALSVALIIIVSAYALTKPEMPNLTSVRNPETTSFQLAENENQTTISATLGLSQKELYSSGDITLSGPLFSGLYNSVLTALKLPDSPMGALKNLNVTLGIGILEPNQTLTSIVGMGDTFANDTGAFSLEAYVTNTFPAMQTKLSAQVSIEKDINDFTPFGSLTVNATSNPNETWYSELETGIKYHFNNGGIITASSIAQFDNEKIKVQEGEVSYSQNNVTHSLSYLPKGKKVEISIDVNF